MGTSINADTAARIGTGAGESDALIARRTEAFERFAALDWPDGASEEWRNTDIRALDIDAFDFTPPRHDELTGFDAAPAAVQEAAIGAKGDRDALAIQLDADVVHLRMAARVAEAGVVFEPFSRGAGLLPEVVGDHMGRGGVAESDEKFQALNAAFASGGAVLYVPRGVKVDKPIQSVRWLTRGGIAICPRVLIVAEEGAEVTYIDHYGSDELDAEALCVPQVEIYAHPNAHVSYLAVQDWSQQVWHFNVQRAVIERDATVRSLAATLGGKLSRSRVDCILDGQGAHSEMLGLYFGDHAQHIDNRSLQDHRAPNTTSDLFYKGAMKGTSHAVYSGLVRIHKDAQKVEAEQANRNLLLSPGAGADPKPFLEIEANDVRCTHGVSVGRPDREVLFYLQSRGLSAEEAERVFVTGFFQEVIDRVRVPEVRATLEHAVEEELALEG